MTSSLASPPSPTKQRRGIDGRFKSQQTTDLSSARRGTSIYKERRRIKQRNVFEGYAKVFFVKGKKEDYVPFSSTSGPFVETFEKIIRGTHLLGRRNRSEILQEIYNAEKHMGFPTQIARRTFKNGSGSGSITRPKVYQYRRLPNPKNYSSEIVPLKNWLKEIIEDSANACSFEEAYDVCLQAMGSYQIRDGNPVYIGFTASKTNDNTDGDDNSSSQENQQLNITDTHDGDTPPNSCANCSCMGTSNGQRGTVLPQVSAIADSEPAGTGTSDLVLSEEIPPSNDPRVGHMTKFLELVHNDTYFRMLCMLFDPSLETKFHFVAGTYLEKNRIGHLNIPSLIKRVLIYSHEKAFGTKKKAEHDERERSLRSLKVNVERARIFFGLQSYEEIRQSQETSWSSPA